MKIAIVKLSAMGDIIHAMVALQFIKQQYPDIQIDWIVEKGLVPVLENNPDIDHILPVNLKAIKRDKKEIFGQIRQIRTYAKREYDMVIDAQGLLKSAVTSVLLGAKRVGFSRTSIREWAASFFYHEKVVIPYDANTIDRNVKVLGTPLGVTVTEKMIIDKKPFLFYEESDRFQSLLSRMKKNIIFVIGSTWESRNYPKEKFAEIAEKLNENILITWGTDDERERALWIASHAAGVKVLPKLDLNGLKAVIAGSDLLIGNDTGPTHMAWGLNRPSITIFGPTPVSRVYQTPINKVIKSDSRVNPYKLDRNDFSIREIESDTIVKMAKELLYG